MADFNLKLNINGIETAVASVEDLEIALKATKEEMKTLQIGSEAFNVAANNAQKLDSALKNVKLATEGVDTKQLAGSFAKLGETVTGAFAIATNAVGLFGKENEDVSKAAVKAQQAIAVVMGARAIAEGVVEGRIAARLILEKVSIANQSLMTSLFGAQAIAMSAQAVATGEATVAQYALNTAMEANPIGIVVLAVTALVGAFALLADSEEEEIERTERLNKIKKEQAEQVDKEVENIKKVMNVKVEELEREKALMQASGASQEELLAKEKQIADERIRILFYVKGYRDKSELNPEELKQLKDLQNQKLVDEAKYNQDQIKISEDKIKKLQDQKKSDAAKSSQIDAEILAEKNAIIVAQETDEIKKIELRQEQKTEFVRGQYDKGIIDAMQYAGKIANIDAEASLQKKVILDRNATEEEKSRADQLKKIESFYALLNTSREQLTDVSNSRIKDKSEQAEAEKNASLEKLNKSYHDRLTEAANVFGSDMVSFDEAEKEILRQKNEEKLLIEQEYQDRVKEIRQAEFDDKVAKVNEYSNIAVEGANSVVALLSAIQDGENQERTQKINAQYSAEENALRDKLNKGEIDKKEYDKREKALNDAKAKAEYDAKKKAFESEKKLRIASTIISGIMGALQAFTGAMQLGPIAGPIVGGILAGLVVATTAVTVSNISKQKFDGGAAPLTPINVPETTVPDGAGGAGAIGGGSGGGITSFNPTLTGAPAGSTPTGGGGAQPPVRVYVVESDITGAQRSVSVAESNATF